MSKDDGCGCAFLLLIFAIIFAIIFVPILLINGHVSYVDGTVINTFVSGGEQFFTVELDNGQREVFSNNDNMLFGKFNSNDLFTQIEVGEHYQFKLSGYRIPITSEFRNIIKIEQTAKPGR